MRRRGIVFVGLAVIAIATAFACGDSGPGTLSNGQTLPPGTTPTGSTPTSTATSTGTTPEQDGGTAGDANVDSGTSPVDAGAGRDLSTDRSKFFGASRCATAGLELCEDFETGALDKTTWTVVGNAPVIDGAEFARGSKALHITVNGSGQSYIKETKTFPATNNTYWGRSFVYFNQLPTPNDAGFTYSHWTFTAASGTGTVGEIRLSAQLNSGSNLFGVGTDSTATDAGTGDWTTSDNDPAGKPKAVPTKQWLCIEWLHDGATNETKFFWDATEHPSLHTTATVHGGDTNPYVLPTFTNVWLGWQEYQPATETFEMWVDEIAIDPSRIGCIL